MTAMMTRLRRIQELRLSHLLLIALALRVVWLLVCRNQPISDQDIYHQSAIRLAQGLGYVDDSGQAAGWWPVGYSALLAPFYAVLGATPTTAALVNIALGLATVAGAYVLGRDLLDVRAGSLAALLVAVYPTFVLYTTCIASENAVFPACVWAPWLALHAARGNWLSALALGVLLGLSGYVRAPTLLLIVALPLIALCTRQNLWRAALKTALAGAIAILVLVPWGIRNQREFGKFSLVSMNGASNLWMGNHPGTSGQAAELPPDIVKLPIPEREQLLGTQAKRFIIENPGTYLALCFKRAYLTLRSDTIAGAWNEVGISRIAGKQGVILVKGVCTIAYYGLLALAAFAVARRARGPGLDYRDLLLATCMAALAVPFVFIVGGNRYHLPLLPLLCAWAGFALASREAGLARTPGLELKPVLPVETTR